MSSIPSVGDSQPLISCSRSLQASLRNLSGFTHAGNTVVCSKGKVSGHPAYDSNEETHVKKSQSSSFGKSCI